jgi:hypothetical protein
MSDSKPNLTHVRLRKFLEQRKQHELARAAKHPQAFVVDRAGEKTSRIKMVEDAFDAQFASIPAAKPPKAEPKAKAEKAK